MLGAIGMVHGQHGFILGRSPTDTLATAGFKYNLALIGLLTPVLIAGPRRFAIGCFLPLPKSAQMGRPVGILE